MSKVYNYFTNTNTTENMGIHFVTEQCVYVGVVKVLFSLHTLDSEISNNNVHMVIFVNLL